MSLARPWEFPPPPPWAAGQALYDRIVDVRRPNRQAAVGSSGYGGLDPTDETVVLMQILASIQLHRQRGQPEGHVPGDAPERSGWWIFIPIWQTTAGGIIERDVVQDDLGRRFVIIGAAPTLLVYEIYADLLQA